MCRRKMRLSRERGASRRYSGMLLLSMLATILLWRPVEALRIVDWNVDVRVFGVAARSLTAPSVERPPTNDTTATPPPPPRLQPKPSALMSYYQTAIINVEFDEAVFVGRRSTNDTTDTKPQLELIAMNSIDD